MQIKTLDTGFFKLDGGAMFGVVPKTLWSKKNPPDANNLCTWAARCLLIRYQERIIVVDTGLGNKQDEKFRSHFEPHGEATLLDSLAAEGVSPAEVTDVLLTHLHFDHVGGATRYDDNGQVVTVFPNAVYWTNDAHWAWANDPNPREAASFLPENLQPLLSSGQLDMIPIEPGKDHHWLPGITLRPVYGHTEAMMLPLFDLGGGQRLAYCADLLASSFHLREPWVMSYDIRPLETLKEKKRFLAEAVDESWMLCFEHDPVLGMATLQQDARGRLQAASVCLTL